MTIRTTPLFEITTTHEFFAGGRCESIELSPTPETADTISRQRMFFRRTPGGCVVLVEVDPTATTLDPLVPISPDLRLDFMIQSSRPEFSCYTALPETGSRFHHLSNRRGSVTATAQLLHPGATLGMDTAALLCDTSLRVDLPVPGPMAALELFLENGLTHASVQLPVTAGHISTRFDLTSIAPGPVSVALAGRVVLRAFSDRSIIAQRPIGVVSLTARTGTEALSLTDNAGRPHNTRLVIAFGARTTIWRYTVVIRTNTLLDETTLLIQDHPPVATVAPIGFNNAQAKHPLANGEQAVVIESTAPVPLQARPRSGLRLLRRIGGETAPLLNDLPNPPTNTLSPASTPGRPVSEVFLYV